MTGPPARSAAVETRTHPSICHFTDTEGFGGAERAMLMLVGELAAMGFGQRIVIHAHAPRQLRRAIDALDVPAEVVAPVPQGARGATRVPELAWRLRQLCPDVFHAHLTWPLACKFGLLAAGLARVPAIVATEQLMLDFEFPATARLQQRIAAQGVGRYIAVSSHVRTSLARLGWPASRIVVIPNAVDLERFDGDPAPTHTRQPGGILTVARLHPQKGHEHLLHALVRLPGVDLQVVGDGPERERLEALTARLGLSGRVSFLGDRRDVPELLSRCDVFVLPSLYEGLPLSLLEAMAARRPVVATAIGGVRELVDDERTGLLVPPADADALAAAIRRLLADEALRRRLTDEAHALVHRRHGKQRMAVDVAAVYASLLPGHRDG